jgi:hypothetical protein
VTKRPAKDVAASIRQRLYNNAKNTGRPFQEVLQYYAMERFLYRLGQSPYSDTFILKGALMFRAWQAPSSRPTKDIDLLARISNRIDSILPVIKEVCLQEVEPDGLLFDVASIQGMVIKEDADYEGVRVAFLAYLQNAEVHMQLDMGFGDIVTPAVFPIKYPTILDLESPKILGYSRESMIAEKFEAMVKLGPINSRMKDFFDIWHLSRQFSFEGDILAEAITNTFSHRGTAIALPLFPLSEAFAHDPEKNVQWRSFLRKSQITTAPDNLGDVVNALSTFLLPVAKGIAEQLHFVGSWDAPGPWQLPSG